VFQAMPLCKKFRFAPLDNEEDVEIMFSGASCTNANAVALGAREGSAGNGKDNGSDDVQEVHPSSAEKQPAKRGAAYKSPKKAKKFLEICSSSILWTHLWRKLVQALQLLHPLIMLGKR
jgi:hypothetical protein